MKHLQISYDTENNSVSTRTVTEKDLNPVWNNISAPAEFTRQDYQDIVTWFVVIHRALAFTVRGDQE